MAQTFKLQRIANGWKNYLFADQRIEKLAHDRAAVCAECPHAVYGTYEKLMKDWSLKKVEGMKCELCGCPLSTKLRAEFEHCPENKW